MRYGRKPYLQYARNVHGRLSWVSWFRLFFLGHLEEQTCFYLGISKLTLWRYLRSYFVSGKVNTRRIGRPFATVQLQPREELIIKKTVLVSIILFDLNRVKLSACKKRSTIVHRGLIDRESWITGATLIQTGVY